VITGDMFTDPLPDGYDVHLYSQVLHDWDGRFILLLLQSWIGMFGSVVGLHWCVSSFG
jgi:hypothetical protein